MKKFSKKEENNERIRTSLSKIRFLAEEVESHMKEIDDSVEDISKRIED